MKKILICIFALAFFAGVFVCSEAVAETLSPWNVNVKVEYNGDVFCYNLAEEAAGLEQQAQQRGFFLGAKAKRKLSEKLLATQLPEDAVHNYILPNFNKLLSHFAYVNQARVDAAVTFDKKGFRYTNGQDGVAINTNKLFDDMINSNGKPVKIALPLKYERAVTTEQLKQNTVERASFCTAFYSSGANRVHNIMRAVESLNGLTIGVGETFSFNNVVGNRTEANGYKTSKIILDGNYTEGVGGGVCQVSTTLYNALLLANIVPSAAQHSLVSSYVKPGFDAMVSFGSADLTFTNTTEHPLYISAWVKDKAVYFSVYGEPNPYHIVRESVEVRDKFSTTYVVDPNKYPELVYTDQTKVVVGGSDGVKTKSYLKYYQNGKLVETKLIRVNNYKKVNAVIAKGYLERELKTQEPLPSAA